MFFQTIMRDPNPHQHKQAGWAHVYAIFPLKAEHRHLLHFLEPRFNSCIWRWLPDKEFLEVFQGSMEPKA